MPKKEGMLEPAYADEYRPGEYDEVIDVRSPAEFAEDHIPSAVNLPVLDNDERARIGTMYVQVSMFMARRAGAALIARNMARHLETHLAGRGKEYRPLVYCWRGGMRSHSMAMVMCEVGWRTTLLSGGYKTYRRQVLRFVDSIPETFTFIVLRGMTGSGKTRLLGMLADRGSQAIDLEGLARHRGSLLGGAPDDSMEIQPAQKMFETELADRLRVMDPARPVWIESESSTIGAIHVPRPLWESMRRSESVELTLPGESRVDYLVREYADLAGNAEAFKNKLKMLAPHCGAKAVEQWLRMVETGDLHGLAADLLVRHYDPAYAHSTKKIFSGPALTVSAPGLSPADTDSIVQELLRFEKTMTGNMTGGL